MTEKIIWFGPSILLDKCALQSLSKPEIKALHAYYTVTIPPVLLDEIRADLTKTDSEKNSVTDLSSKLLPYNSFIAVHFNELICGNLLGHEVPMDGRVPARTATGRWGARDSERRSEIESWQKSLFSEADNAAAEAHRAKLGGLDLDYIHKGFLHQMKSMEGFAKAARSKSFHDLFLFITGLLTMEDRQLEVLTEICARYVVDLEDVDKVFDRWNRLEKPALDSFAPYAFYCERLILAFVSGIILGILPRKTTNTLDMEYLCYLPFCDVFCWGDAFHEKVMQPFLRHDQTTIPREELKADLRENALTVDLAKQIEDSDETWIRGNVIPPHDETLSRQLWAKYAHQFRMASR